MEVFVNMLLASVHDVAGLKCDENSAVFVVVCLEEQFFKIA